MKEEGKGETSSETLFEQYKLYVEMSNDLSKRRHQTNQFYISLSSALIAIFSLVTAKFGLMNHNFLLIFPILGIILCVVWFTHLQAYKKLNSAKFKVINKIEEKLPCQGFTEEWDILKKKHYKGLTRIESLIPLILLIFNLTIIYFLYAGLNKGVG